jgi:hypothetical protein
MFQEVIVCDQCGAEGCTVKEITVQPVNPRLTMTEFAEKHGHSRGKTQVREEQQQANNRAFEIKCLRCGHTHHFQPGVIGEE